MQSQLPRHTTSRLAMCTVHPISGLTVHTIRFYPQLSIALAHTWDDPVNAHVQTHVMSLWRGTNGHEKKGSVNTTKRAGKLQRHRKEGKRVSMDFGGDAGNADEELIILDLTWRASTSIEHQQQRQQVSLLNQSINQLIRLDDTLSSFIPADKFAERRRMRGVGPFNLLLLFSCFYSLLAVRFLTFFHLVHALLPSESLMVTSWVGLHSHFNNVIRFEVVNIINAWSMVVFWRRKGTKNGGLSMNLADLAQSWWLFLLSDAPPLLAICVEYAWHHSLTHALIFFFFRSIAR